MKNNMRKHMLHENHMDQELCEKITRVLREYGNIKESITIEQLEEWVNLDRERRKLRNRMQSIYHYLVKK